MSTTNIKDNYTLGSNTDLSVAKTDYATGISKLNDLCVPYGKGTYALGARSITVEDVDKLTGYDKTTYNEGLLNEYGNVVTYKYNGTNKPAYEGANGVNGILSIEYSNELLWYDAEKGWQSVTESNLKNAENDGEEITKLTSTYYYYNVAQKTDLSAGTDVYSMLFGSNGREIYWLASPYISARSDYNSFGFRAVNNAEVYASYFVRSNGTVQGNSYGVRAVVRFSSDIKLTGSSTNG